MLKCIGYLRVSSTPLLLVSSSLTLDWAVQACRLNQKAWTLSCGTVLMECEFSDPANHTYVYMAHLMRSRPSLQDATRKVHSRISWTQQRRLSSCEAAFGGLGLHGSASSQIHVVGWLLLLEAHIVLQLLQAVMGELSFSLQLFAVCDALQSESHQDCVCFLRMLLHGLYPVIAPGVFDLTQYPCMRCPSAAAAVPVQQASSERGVPALLILGNCWAACSVCL